MLNFSLVLSKFDILQPSEEHYRTAATSPFPIAPNSIGTTAAAAAAAAAAASSSINAGSHQSGAGQIPEIIVSQQAANATILTTTPGGATIERGIQAANETEIRRSHQRSYDEYESDDELRREEISFAMDGGKICRNTPHCDHHDQ